MIGWLRKLIGSKPRADSQVIPLSRFDSAQTTDQNYLHWSQTDGLGPNASASPDVRKILRERSRYERDNDPHLNGLSRQTAQDLVGTGPRLQLLAPDAPPEDVRQVELAWSRWSRASKFPTSLRLMVEAKPFDGEVFGLLASNPRIRHAVKLELRPFECDLVADPLGGVPREGDWDDGIQYDEAGNPVRYTVLKSYPGDPWFGVSGYDLVEASLVVHWFRAYRPGQRRGVSEYASSLAVVSQLRRYSQAVLTNAEFAASIAGVMYTNSTVDDPAPVTPMDKVRIVNGTMLTMPYGWKADHFKSDQPTSTYKDYATDKRNEVARPVNAPLNVMTGNSSGYNYSSGRLDHVPYQRNVWIDREAIRPAVLDPVAIAFLNELQKLGELPASLGPIDEIEFEFQWDGFNSIDPLKDAQASDLRMRIGLTTLAEECAAEGRNWRDVLEQQKREMDLRKQLGLPEATPVNTAAARPETNDEQDDELDEGGEDADETDDDTTLEKKEAPRVPA